MLNKLSKEAHNIIPAKALKLIEEDYDEVFAAHSSSHQTPQTESSSKGTNNNKSKDWFDIVEEKNNAKLDSVSHVSDLVEGNKAKEFFEEDMDIDNVYWD